MLAGQLALPLPFAEDSNRLARPAEFAWDHPMAGLRQEHTRATACSHVNINGDSEPTAGCCNNGLVGQRHAQIVSCYTQGRSGEADSIAASTRSHVTTCDQSLSPGLRPAKDIYRLW